jgi:hypothetical protein
MNSIANDSFDIVLSNHEYIEYQISKKDQETGVISLSL